MRGMRTRVVLLAVVVAALCGGWSARVSAITAVAGHGGEPEQQQQQQQAVLAAGKEKGAFQARLHEEDLAAEKEAAVTPEKKTLKEHFAEKLAKHNEAMLKLESEHEKSANADKRGFAKSAKRIATEHEATVTNCDDSLIKIDADGLKKVAAGCAKEAAGVGEGGAFLEESHEESPEIEKAARRLRSLSKNSFR